MKKLQFIHFVGVPPWSLKEAPDGSSFVRAHRRSLAAIVLFAIAVAGASPAHAQVTSVAARSAALKKLSLEELASMSITSVSRKPEKLTEAASAIQVVTNEDIRRSGATRLPEALRLATNLQVAQRDASQWAISARGFNGTLANKMLVMIDGRTVYTPLFAGVFWDIQEVLLEDIDQIEVVSGPGATLWGANAVNGIISITTRSAADTQGWFVQGGVGTELRHSGALRYGGAISSNAHFRVYGQSSKRDGTLSTSGPAVTDNWHIGQGGLRADWQVTPDDQLTLQGDIYRSRTSIPGPDDPISRGGNVIGRWTRTFSPQSEISMQFYYDRVHRRVPGSFDDTLDTYDLDFQHRLPFGKRHNVVWGGGHRQVEDDFGSDTPILSPQRARLQTYSAFLQDTIALDPRNWHLTLGTKFEHNEYTGFEWQPSARVAWRPDAQRTIWAAVSRAVRTPSRVDRDLMVPGLFAGGPNFDSEELIAYEAGGRMQVNERLTMSVAAYYHDYDGIRSSEPRDPPAPRPLVLRNGHEGESYGIELTTGLQVTDAWRLSAGFSELRVDIRAKPGSLDASQGASEAADSKHHLRLRSSLDLPGPISWDATLRYVSRVTNPNQDTPGYTELDMRLAWSPAPGLELEAIGQNILHDRHAEFGQAGGSQKIERNIQGRVSWRF